MKVSKFKTDDWVCYRGPDDIVRPSHSGIVVGLEDCEHTSGNLWLITILREDDKEFKDYHYI